MQVHENEETKIPLFLSYHRDEDRNNGAAEESKFQRYHHSLWTKSRYVMHLWRAFMPRSNGQSNKKEDVTQI